MGGSQTVSSSNKQQAYTYLTVVLSLDYISSSACTRRKQGVLSVSPVRAEVRGNLDSLYTLCTLSCLLLANMEQTEVAVTCFICSNTARYKCPKCQEIVFCSEEHGELHISDHVGDCFPYSLQDGSLMSTRDIKCGEVIFIQSPVIIGPVGNINDGGVCLGCHSILDIETCDSCSGCGYPMCHQECHHPSLECQLLSVLSPITDNYLAVTLLRLLMLKYTNLSVYQSLLRAANSLKSCCNVMVDRESLIGDVYKRFNEYWTTQEIQSAIEVVETRSRVLSANVDSVGHIGLYPVAMDTVSSGYNSKYVTNTQHPDGTVSLVATGNIREREKIIGSSFSEKFQSSTFSNNKTGPNISSHCPSENILENEQ